jgi:hypothetical protein
VLTLNPGRPYDPPLESAQQGRSIRSLSVDLCRSWWLLLAIVLLKVRKNHRVRK